MSSFILRGLRALKTHENVSPFDSSYDNETIYGVSSSVGRTLDCGSSSHRFKSYLIPNASLTQLVE